jgi:hypothetical protein
VDAAMAVSPSLGTVAGLLTALVFAASFPLLLLRRGDDPAAAARLRVAQRWCAVVFGAALYLAWRGSAFA